MLEQLKPAEFKEIVATIAKSRKPVNVSQVRQLSPFRYPGGKTWLIPEVRKWLQNIPKPQLFIEPFAGGAMCGLTVAAEDLAGKVILCEKDDDVAAVWQTIFNGSDADVDWFCERIVSFQVSLPAVKEALSADAGSTREKAFKTILKNRMQRGGIMAAGAGLIKAGEGGRGLLSRWYPETLASRIKALRLLKDKVEFEHGDAFEVIARHAASPENFFFVDPPYTAGGKRAGSRLYTHSVIDHPLLFSSMEGVSGRFMLTYDDAKEVKELAEKHHFDVCKIPMKSTHHEVKYELLIFR